MRKIIFVLSAALAGTVLAIGSALAGTTAISVPEPASLALLALGVGVLAAIKLRRHR
jgi:uncharacterized membrane protein YdcZ (DUF606 family)